MDVQQGGWYFSSEHGELCQVIERLSGAKIFVAYGFRNRMRSFAYLYKSAPK